MRARVRLDRVSPCPRTTSGSAWQSASARGTPTRSPRRVVDPVVDFLAELARGGGALELGIDTGWIALPLAQRGVRVHADAPRLRRVRRRPAGPRLTPVVDRGRQGRRLFAAVSLRVAVGARLDGKARRDGAARALERLEGRAVHERQHEARFRLGEDGFPRVGREFRFPVLQAVPWSGLYPAQRARMVNSWAIRSGRAPPRPSSYHAPLQRTTPA